MSDTTLRVLIYGAPLALYFIPAFIAMARGHRQKGAIFALNLLLGWTLIGWVGAFIWALIKPQEPQVIYVGAQPPATQPLPLAVDGDEYPSLGENMRDFVRELTGKRRT